MKLSIDELNDLVESLCEDYIIVIESVNLKNVLIELRANYNIENVNVSILENDLFEVSLVE